MQTMWDEDVEELAQARKKDKRCQGMSNRVKIVRLRKNFFSLKRLDSGSHFWYDISVEVDPQHL
jgi:hypothetical protein